MNNLDLKSSANFEAYFSPVQVRYHSLETSRNVPPNSGLSLEDKKLYCRLFDLNLTNSTEVNLSLELDSTVAQNNSPTLLTLTIEMSPAQELLYKEIPFTIMKQTQKEAIQANNLTVPEKTHTKASKKKDSKSNLRAILKRKARSKPIQRAQWTTHLMSDRL